MTNVTKVGVVAQNRAPCVSGVIFTAVLTLETQGSLFLGNYRSHANETYMWSAVSACSESRDRFLKFGRGHFRCDVISGSIGCLATRPRYSCSAALICI